MLDSMNSYLYSLKLVSLNNEWVSLSPNVHTAGMHLCEQSASAQLWSFIST